MSIYECIVSALEGTKHPNISLGFIKNRCNIIQEIIDENDGTEFKVKISNDGRIIISLYTVYLSTKNVNEFSSVFSFANKIEVRAIDDETFELTLEF